jgi:hypothetical protein
MGHFGQLSAQQIDQRAVRAEAEQLLAGWKKKEPVYYVLVVVTRVWWMLNRMYI